MKKIAFSLLGATLPFGLHAIPQQDGPIEITHIQSAPAHVIGYESPVSFELAAPHDIERLLVKVGYKIATGGLSVEQSLHTIDSSEADAYLTSFELTDLKAYQPVVVNQPVLVQEHIPAGDYALVIATETFTDEAPAAQILDLSSSANSYAFAPELTTVDYPELPNLELLSAGLSGDSGYSLSLSESPSVLRLNMELLARSHAIFEPLSAEFVLSAPGLGEARLPLSLENDQNDPSGESHDGNEGNAQWQLTAACDTCPVLPANTAIGASLNLALSPDVLSRLQPGTQATLRVQLDPQNAIEEWQGNSSDNAQSVALYIFD